MPRPGPLPLAIAAGTTLLASLRLLVGAGHEEKAPRPPLVWTAVPDAWLEGLALLRGGDAKQGLASLRLAESQLATAPPELLRARLAAALAAADGMDAEATVEKLATRTDAEALRSFVRGLAEFARCQLASRQAKLPGGDPGAFDRAIRMATESARAFTEACLLHEGGEWPAARRNAERVLAVRQELVRAQEAHQRDQRREKEPDRPEPKQEPQRIEAEVPLSDAQALLTPADLQALLRRLAAAENEKRSARRAVRDARSVTVEKDW